MKPLVYCAVNRINGHEYIGVTIAGLKERRYNHLSAARNGSRLPFHIAICKYGSDSFEWVVLAEFETEIEALAAEIAFIAERKPRYNVAKGGKGISGLRHTEEAKRKIGNASRGRKLSEKTRAKMVAAALARPPLSPESRARAAEGRRGKRMTDEQRARISAGLKGRVVSASTRAKISDAHKGKKLAPATIAAIAAKNRGRKQSPEEIARRSAALRGRVITPEHRAKLSAANSGKKHSAAARAKMSAAQRGKPKPKLRGQKRSAETVEKLRQSGLRRREELKSYFALGPAASAKPVRCIDDGIVYASASEAARAYNAVRSSVIELCNGNQRRKSVAGRRFEYVEKSDAPA